MTHAPLPNAGVDGVVGAGGQESLSTGGYRRTNHIEDDSKRDAVLSVPGVILRQLLTCSAIHDTFQFTFQVAVDVAIDVAAAA